MHTHSGRLSVHGILTLVFAAGLGPAGCTSPPAAAPPAPPEVAVSRPVAREVTNYQQYTGRTAAVQALDVRAQVTGYLQQINFTEGADVPKGAVLYKIDPSTYQAALNQVAANVREAEARESAAADTYQRDLATPAATPEATAIQDRDALAQARAASAAAQAGRQAAQLNVNFTDVASPIAGQVGRTNITLGNLVVANQTLLTTVVSPDPLYAYFDVDEPTVEHIRQLIIAGKLPSAREQGKKIPVDVGLTSEEGYPHQGYVDFISNQVNASTATLEVRGVIENPKPPVGPRLLSPGQFVRVRLAVGPPYPALLVLGAAVGYDQNLSYVYVVNDQNQVQRRDVTLGEEQGGLTVVAQGVNPDDRVVVSGLQHVRPGMAVKPNLTPMPDPDANTEPQAPPTGAGQATQP